MEHEMTYDQHAQQARTSARSRGWADCIHYAPNWQSRADALYDRLCAMGGSPDHIGLLQDDRMGVTGKLLPLNKRPREDGNIPVSVFEVRS